MRGTTTGSNHRVADELFKAIEVENSPGTSELVVEIVNRLWVTRMAKGRMSSKYMNLPRQYGKMMLDKYLITGN